MTPVTSAVSSPVSHPDSSPDSSPVPRRVPPAAWYWVVPAILILLIQVALYVWMAPRGFDFTDESYYFHNYLHWREFTGTVTFFGAYFEWPFRAMGASIAGIRLLSLALVLASGAVLMHYLLRYAQFAAPGREAESATLRLQWPLLVAPMASAMLYFGYLATLRAPSYNLLSLCAMALATACLLRTLEQRQQGRVARLAPFLYGVALGACALSKASTALILTAAHLLFFVAVNRDWAWKRLLGIAALVTAGVALNLALLGVQFPGWLASLREGIEVMRMRGGYGALHMLKDASWEMQRALMRCGPWLLALALLLALVRRKLDATARGAISLLAVAMVAASALTITLEHQSELWLLVLGASALGLWSLELLARRGQALTRADYAELALMALLFFLPLAFSFGTNMSVLGHSAIASVFAFCAVYLRLYRLWRAGMLGGAALALAVSMLCLPALAAQWLALTDVRHTYRQHSALGAQREAVALGAQASALRVDQRTAGTLRDIAQMVARAGFKPGQDMLDLSGDGPGVIYAVGAKPLGTPWMIGGYPGSAAAAGRVMSRIDPGALRGAWLLTSSNNPRRILGWEPMLAARVGAAPAHALAASIDVAPPYPWFGDAGQTVNLQLWKPVAAPR